ncbi:hypothetical protein DFH08DRAFT_976195 [Mycena albidolilacea]|uniref:Uncharacterized protein n=1 Tax=Mycena albidolilacea TaxID=1033008 RepID=A0AAD6Z479_9AGAR|nr:hypothetical protein DFH08DRAFT_976195 [Mycena albidolilacea]
MPLGVGTVSGRGAASAAASSVGLTDLYPPCTRRRPLPTNGSPQGYANKISPNPNGATHTVTSLLAPKLGSTVERSIDATHIRRDRPDAQASDLRSDVAPKDDHAPTTIRHATPRANYKELSRLRCWPNPEKRGTTIRYLSALEVDNPQNTTPAKSRKVEHTDDSSFARTQRHLQSPEDRIATRKSSLPSSSALNADDDPFGLGYQLAHRTQSGLVTHSATPLAFTEDEELEEGELPQDTAQPATPRARATYLPNHTGSVSPAPSLPASLPPVSRSVSPAASEHSDVPMEDDTDYGALVRDPGFGAKAPTHHDEDPHIAYDGFNPTGPDDHAGVPFQKHAGGGARLVMSHETMMTNALQRVVDLIASDPDRFILFMPFLGGHHFHNRYRNAATDLAKQLEQVTGVGGIAIYPPSANDANKANFAGNPLYHPPWVLVGQCTTKEIRDSVARHELIACNEDLTVHVSKVDMGRQSWCLGQFRCNSIAPLPAAVPRGAVAVHVFEQGPLRTAIAHATQNDPGSADKRVFDFAETLRATYLESPTEPIWVIYGHPFTKDHATWEMFRDLFRNTKFASGLVEFTPIGSPNRAAGDNIRRLALCYICKLEDHRSDTCPYRSLTDFVGAKDVLKPAREGILALVKGKPGVRPHDDAPSSSRGRNQRRRRF